MKMGRYQKKAPKPAAAASFLPHVFLQRLEGIKRVWLLLISGKTRIRSLTARIRCAPLWIKQH
jgi:hypothetical protein